VIYYKRAFIQAMNKYLHLARKTPCCNAEITVLLNPVNNGIVT